MGIQWNAVTYIAVGGVFVLRKLAMDDHSTREYV
jgi:hypothetical protein